MFSQPIGGGENVKKEVDEQNVLIEQIMAALGGSSQDPQPAVANALTASGSVYLTVKEE